MDKLHQETLDIIDMSLAQTERAPEWIQQLNQLESDIEDLEKQSDKLKEAIDALPDNMPAQCLEELEGVQGRLVAIHEELDSRHTELVEASPEECVVDAERLKELENDLIWREVKIDMGLSESPHGFSMRREISPQTFFESDDHIHPSERSESRTIDPESSSDRRSRGPESPILKLMRRKRKNV